MKLDAPYSFIPQICMGNLLLQVYVLFMLELLAAGGCGVLEHPAFIDLHHRFDAASIWCLPEIRNLLSHPCVEEKTLCQADFGGIAVKPTTLMALRLDTIDARLYESQVPRRQDLIRLGSQHRDNSFKTALTKEYPLQFCCGIALAIRDFVESRLTFISTSIQHAPTNLILTPDKGLTVCAHLLYHLTRTST